MQSVFMQFMKKACKEYDGRLEVSFWSEKSEGKEAIKVYRLALIK